MRIPRHCLSVLLPVAIVAGANLPFARRAGRARQDAPGRVPGGRPPSSAAANDRAGSAQRHGGGRYALSGAKRLLDDPQLLLDGPSASAGRAGDDLDPLVVVRHKPVPEDIPKPPCLSRVSGRNGGQFRYCRCCSLIAPHVLLARAHARVVGAALEKVHVRRAVEKRSPEPSCRRVRHVMRAAVSVQYVVIRGVAQPKSVNTTHLRLEAASMEDY
jgi:hypothetical protein